MIDAFINFYLIIVAFAVQSAYTSVFDSHGTENVQYSFTSLISFAAFIFFSATFIIWTQQLLSKHKNSMSWWVAWDFLVVSMQAGLLILGAGFLYDLGLAFIPILCLLGIDIVWCLVAFYRGKKYWEWISSDIIAIFLIALGLICVKDQTCQAIFWFVASFELLAVFLFFSIKKSRDVRCLRRDLASEP